MTEIIQYPLPPGITEEYIQELRQRSERRRKAEELAREILGETYEKPKMSFVEYTLTLPEMDWDDSVFERHPERGGSNVFD